MSYDTPLSGARGAFSLAIDRLVELYERRIEQKDRGLKKALEELGRRHDGSPECTEAIKEVREALERME